MYLESITGLEKLLFSKDDVIKDNLNTIAKLTEGNA